ncbi:hypothetical protein CAPTEDRAFT_172916 [Capitella teleta]|uniref:Replication protein A subunit n=1 Tax=Capitella teleta TaxID=283909 RepID=R7V2A0_CAPTE|nr:hypothetical protein CAPTEDRAFT_172916 [Capitella teleta]|eukprot:ELU09821.1 hypothetical protein CAPTEDRAFT_172916 [Capitella teleta]
MSYNLTAGAIEDIMGGSKVESPILQCLDWKKISSQQGADRFRLLLSDGVCSHSSAMLATQLNDKVTNGELEPNSVIKLDKYLCNTINGNRRVMILLEITVIAKGAQVGSRLGNPTPYKLGESKEAKVEQPVAKPVQNSISNNQQNKPQNSFYNNSSSKPFVAAQPSINGPGDSPVRVHPISSLNPYQNRWTIKVRVTSKSQIRTWSNSRGEGKLFSMTFMDDSGEIKATAFKDQVDKFYDMIEMNKVFFVKKGTLKTADKRYNTTDNDYEMTFNNDTEIIPCDDDTSLPTINFNFVEIGNLQSVEPNSNVDVLGVVKSVAEVSTITTKQTNKELKKRELELVDRGQVLVRLTLWGLEAENFNSMNNPVVAAKNVRVSDFGGRSLSCGSSSQLVLNPDIPQAHQLRGWYDSEGRNADFNAYSSEAAGSGSHSTNWKSFGDVKSQNLGTGEKGDYFTAKGTIVYLRKENCMYMACPQADCNKKVVDQANGYYRCEKCQKEFPNFKWRMILSANVADFSDNQWVTCFQESAENVLGISADELGKLRSENEAAFDKVFDESVFKSYVMTLRAKMETYNEETRLKVICLKATPVVAEDYHKKLISEIEQMLSI